MQQRLRVYIIFILILFTLYESIYAAPSGGSCGCRKLQKIDRPQRSTEFETFNPDNLKESDNGNGCGCHKIYVQPAIPPTYQPKNTRSSRRSSAATGRTPSTKLRCQCARRNDIAGSDQADQAQPISAQNGESQATVNGVPAAGCQCNTGAHQHVDVMPQAHTPDTVILTPTAYNIDNSDQLIYIGDMVDYSAAAQPIAPAMSSPCNCDSPAAGKSNPASLNTPADPVSVALAQRAKDAQLVPEDKIAYGFFVQPIEQPDSKATAQATKCESDDLLLYQIKKPALELPTGTAGVLPEITYGDLGYQPAQPRKVEFVLSAPKQATSATATKRKCKQGNCGYHRGSIQARCDRCAQSHRGGCLTT